MPLEPINNDAWSAALDRATIRWFRERYGVDPISRTTVVPKGTDPGPTVPSATGDRESLVVGE